MKIVLHRINDDGDSTIGYIKVDGQFMGYTLEDEHRDVKVRGETRIPSGIFRVKFREVVSGKTTDYRKRYDWFNWHLMLQDVPDFNYVYLHIGNTEKHTDGCILIGGSPDYRKDEADFLGKSTPIFKRFYLKVKAALDAGDPVHIEIRDEI